MVPAVTVIESVPPRATKEYQTSSSGVPVAQVVAIPELVAPTVVPAEVTVQAALFTVAAVAVAQLSPCAFTSRLQNANNIVRPIGRGCRNFLVWVKFIAYRFVGFRFYRISVPTKTYRVIFIIVLYQ
jgi:hypothetical protein